MLRKAAVRFGCNGFGSIEYFMNLSIIDLLMIANDIQEATKNGR